ncbi:hypothetical protein MTR67_047628 [Solanum verrucosum]|uniref:DUF4283 domain-containing protein n=1 Tax=Solanum verrucosum TaxID=315347 RepID=A0AAF0ZYE1_SOLVR|nr:hypothetical protein MTR67_047628 [Solanum verrucosum]
MAATTTGQPPPEVGLVIASGGTYAEKLKPKMSQYQPIPLKPIIYLHGEPQVIWEQEEVNQMIVNENLEYAVIGKFSYGLPNIQDLRKLIPKQCELKGDCNIRLLSNRHVLIRATLLEDYIHLLSKPAFYITQNKWSYPMRTLKWDSLFNPEAKTTTTIAWISFPSLPPNCFGTNVVFSLAAAVGKPLQIDMATKNQTRSSCARVKVQTHKVDRSNNSKGVKEAGRATSSERTISEVRNKEKHADPKNLQKGVNEEELMQKSTTTRSSYTKRREGEVTSRNLFASNYEEQRDNVVEEGGIPKGSDLIEEYEGEMQNKKDTEEDADIEFNIQQISKADDLSPRHTDNLKNGARKGRPIIPLQVKTRSSRDRGHSIQK